MFFWGVGGSDSKYKTHALLVEGFDNNRIPQLLFGPKRHNFSEKFSDLEK